MTAENAYPLSPDHYAENSRLASGKWAKIEVKQTGVQLITNSTLRNLGFANPEKVNVYGYGGRMLPEYLDEDMIDDLPPVPAIRTAQGIVFFGHSTISWNYDPSNYTHTLNPYSDRAFYFISDSDNETFAPGDMPAVEATADAEPYFTERLVHERDILAPYNSGRLMLGEDFKAQRNQNFQFSLPGISGEAMMTVRFGAKVTNGSSSLIFSANGNTLPSTTADKISGVNSSGTFLALGNSTKRIEDCGEKLNLQIKYSNTGALFTAALDYIRITYQRELKLHENELYFYLAPDNNAVVNVDGCDSNTVIWNVTDPANPLKIAYTLNGSKATFAIPAGYGEYVAFNPTKVTRQATAAGKVNNQNLHALPAPGLLIITPSEYRAAADKIAAIHEKSDGLTSLVVTPETIYNEFSSGTPDVTAFRKLLKMWFDRAAVSGEKATRYCLIMSRPTYDNKMNSPAVKNAGYPRVPIWQSPTGETESSSYSTDDYVGMMEDYYPGLSMINAKIDVAVGRMPVKSATEALSAANKLERYVLQPTLGAWRNNVMVIADDQDKGVHLDQAEMVCDAMQSNGNGKDYLYERLYLDAYKLSYSATGPVYPEAKQRMFDKLAEGVMLWNYIGHANPKSWGHENLLTWSDITWLNHTKLPFLYAATCEFMRWDADETSGGEMMWLNPDSGVIGMICPSRTVLISRNGPLDIATSEFVFQRDADGMPLRIGDMMIKGKNAIQNEDNKLKYGLMGDPAMRLPSPSYRVVVDRINDNDLSDSDNLPTIAARSSVSLAGRITDFEGNTIEDFNGQVQFMVYDAEKAITTNGNGKDGKPITYNDRKTRLITSKAKATGGVWETVINMPAEIENNYSPALLSLYAHDAAGREANGSTDRFFIYGMDPNAPEDNDGPLITSLFLNSESFSDGMTTGPSPIVRAFVSDPSGINVSDAGIGHKITIDIDKKTYLNDVSLYFSPDESDPTAGEISYPLNALDPGEHTLTLTVWDNANNSSSASISFKVAAAWLPSITALYTDANPASTNVNFFVKTDAADGITECRVEVFNLAGKLIWSGKAGSMSASQSIIGWNLCDSNGVRVERGIYPYRAIITTNNGAEISKSGKLAVTAK